MLNDEAHHVANEHSSKVKKWKEFLTHPDYAFRYIIGVSGTCYVENDFFADVIYRYSLRQAMEERYVKRIEYVTEMPETKDPDDIWQLYYNHHEHIKRKLKTHSLVPLSIVVTPTISDCQDVAEQLQEFLIGEARLDRMTVKEQVLVVYNGAPDVLRLRQVDDPASRVEWVVAVSMLNEGWDVKRVFQIIPHEKRAFNSKLLIAQVLGRGLRVPVGWQGPQAEVTVFNHEAWASEIRHLVTEILEMEKRLSSFPVANAAYHFDLHTFEYSWDPDFVKKPMEREYHYFDKGYVDLSTDYADEEVTVSFERAAVREEAAEQYEWKTHIQHRVYTPREIARVMYERFQEAQDPDDPDVSARTIYTDQFPVSRLEEIVKASLVRIGATLATEDMRQRFLQAMGTLRRKESEYLRYSPNPTMFRKIHTSERQTDSVSAAELRRDKTVFIAGERSRSTLRDEQLEIYDEVVEPGTGYKCVPIPNSYDFKTPLNLVIADSENERKFIKALLDPDNLRCYDAWIKSTAVRFYEIDYFWKKHEHPKRGKFSPDFFIKVGDLILVVEIKGDEELVEPSDENRKKNEYASAHFARINERLKQDGLLTRYKFNFLTASDFITYFKSLREGTARSFRSNLDVRLDERD